MNTALVTLFINTLLLMSVHSGLPMSLRVQRMTLTINRIWKDDSKKPSTKPKIYSRTIDRQIIDPNESWSNCRAVRIKPGNQCNFLVVVDQTVKGVKNVTNLEGQEIFQLETYGKSIVRLKHVASNQYIFMNNRGHIQVTKDALSEESLFLHILEEKTYMDTFASIKYYMKEDNFDLFLGVRSLKKFECRTKNGKRTRADQKSNQFYLDTTNIDQTEYCKKGNF